MSQAAALAEATASDRQCAVLESLQSTMFAVECFKLLPWLRPQHQVDSVLRLNPYNGPKSYTRKLGLKHPVVCDTSISSHSLGSIQKKGIQSLVEVL
jgi:hypothetical protein